MEDFHGLRPRKNLQQLQKDVWLKFAHEHVKHVDVFWKPSVFWWD